MGHTFPHELAGFVPFEIRFEAEHSAPPIALISKHFASEVDWCMYWKVFSVHCSFRDPANSSQGFFQGAGLGVSPFLSPPNTTTKMLLPKHIKDITGALARITNNPSIAQPLEVYNPEFMPRKDELVIAAIVGVDNTMRLFISSGRDESLDTIVKGAIWDLDPMVSHYICYSHTNRYIDLKAVMDCFDGIVAGNPHCEACVQLYKK